MLELLVQCRNRARVIDPSSALSSVFGSKWATFYIDKEKVHIIFKVGTLEYWKLIIDNRGGLGGRHFLYVDYWYGWNRPTLSWDFWGHAPRGLKIKLRPTFFGL